MLGTRTDSRLGRIVGIAVAGLAAVMLFLDETTDLPVPYGYDGEGVGFVVGALVAVLVVVVAVLRYREGT